MKSLLFEGATRVSIQGLDICKSLGLPEVRNKLKVLNFADVRDVGIREFWEYSPIQGRPCLNGEMLIRKTKTKGVYQFVKKIYGNLTLTYYGGSFKISGNNIVFLDSMIKTGVEAYNRFSGACYLVKAQKNLLQAGQVMKISRGDAGVVWYIRNVNDSINCPKFVFVKEDRLSGEKIESQPFEIE